MVRVWCQPCGVHHECEYDHGPDGHGGSSICCPQRRQAVQAVRDARRLTVKAAWRNGGNALVHLEEGATADAAAREALAYLRRGATTVTIERGLGREL